ncbi:rab-GTPase-TBC domain-containing protein [Suillus paluster]|uniref:rab-GTPase-TBC domain-containing protein n=1 Tax=Suillus paluster TaxID=48578 RepID=UPI001B862A7A|nr:rab-GTPase-TBC domain-containing protein [Suillus paluster]KAG1748328.1 rab-GTPase-TBC domain-containing protein [Suillus paluster]
MLDEDTIDWYALQAQSLRTGGFGKDRTRVWCAELQLFSFVELFNLLYAHRPALLGVHAPSEPPPYTEVSAESSTDDAPHPDERQVRLDTDRSFVMYPAEDDDDESRRTVLQTSLNNLIVSLLRKRPKLHYFQGYHDIVTVIFLTLPPELQLPCVEQLSLHRVRDSMGPTLEPVLGLLRILRNLLRIIDPKYARLLERYLYAFCAFLHVVHCTLLNSIAPLPFHALSNLLTLFSHEVPTLPLIQHVWDFLLCREPLAVVWLAAAVILVRKPDVLKLAIEGEDGMIHSVLSALPPLSDGSETTDNVPSDQHTRSGSPDEEDKVAFSAEEPKQLSEAPDGNARNESPIGQQQIIDPKPVSCLTENGASQDTTDGQVVRGESSMAANADHSVEHLGVQRSENLHPALFSAQPQETEECAATVSSETHIDNTTDVDADADFPTPPTSLRTSRSSFRTASRSPSPPPPISRQAPISLPSLLTHAAQLLEAYPPTLPQLRVKDILGPKSVVHTWRPPREGFSTPSGNERDDDVEGWVGSPDVVVPFIEDEDIEESETERKTKSRKGPATRHRRFILLHRLRLRFGLLTSAEKRVLLVGAVAVVGIAVALRHNRGLADMQKGWIAWVRAFAGGV